MPCRRGLLVRLAVLGGLLGPQMGLAQVGMHAVEFIELASGDSSLAGAPMLLVAGNARERAELVRLTDRPALASRLRRSNVRHHRIVGIFAGPVGSSGHRLEVKDVHAGPDAVKVTVELVRPGPDQNVNDVISYPYAIVAMPRSELPRCSSWAVVNMKGELLMPPQSLLVCEVSNDDPDNTGHGFAAWRYRRPDAFSGSQSPWTAVIGCHSACIWAAV